MKKLLTIIIIIIIAIILFVFLRPSEEVIVPEIQTNNAEQEIISDEKNLTVIYTSEGFKPQEIEIVQGETIEFLNQSDNGMWIASAQHPTHTVYPKKSGDDCFGSSFDACKSITNGVSWSFTFDELGEWGYHNHIQSSDWGRVIVK